MALTLDAAVKKSNKKNGIKKNGIMRTKQTGHAEGYLMKVMDIMDKHEGNDEHEGKNDKFNDEHDDEDENEWSLIYNDLMMMQQEGKRKKRRARQLRCEVSRWKEGGLQ